MEKKNSGESSQRGPGRPVTQTKKATKSSQKGTKENESRIAFIVNDLTIEKIKSIAYLKRKTIKDVVGVALASAIGNMKPRKGRFNRSRRNEQKIHALNMGLFAFSPVCIGLNVLNL